MNEHELKEKIEELVREYYQKVHRKDANDSSFEKIQYSGRVYDDREMVNLVDAALEFWLTAGHYVDQFERGFANYLDVKHCSLTNSGSSANLCAFMALTSPKLGSISFDLGRNQKAYSRGE